MRHDVWNAITTLACLIAAGTCFAAVALHAMEVSAGYDLGDEEAAHTSLARDVRAAEQRVTGLRSPAVVFARAAEMGLNVGYSDRPLVVRPEDVRYLRKAGDGDPEALVLLEER
jgi:hypothetical protein